MAPVPGATPDERQHQDGVYLQVARGMTFDGSVLTLDDLSPSTIFVGSGDRAGVGYLSTGDFLDSWSRWRSEHEDRCAHGVLSLLDAGARLAGDPHVLLHGPRIHGSGLAYDVEHLRGVLPSSSGSCVLLVEPRWDLGPLRRSAHGESHCAWCPATCSATE
jgi:hypothetical protein